MIIPNVLVLSEYRIYSDTIIWDCVSSIDIVILGLCEYFAVDRVLVAPQRKEKNFLGLSSI